MRDDERVRPVMETSRLSSGESLVCERETLIFDAFFDF